MANPIKTLALLAGGAVCSILVTLPAPSSALSIIDSTAQSGGSGSRGTFQLTSTTDNSTPQNPNGTTGPYNYTDQQAALNSLISIERIAVTLQLVDGNTALGEFDFGNLTLGLDGFDTGIRLNGFRNNQTDTLRIESTTLNGANILAALKADSRLVGTIFDASPLTRDPNRLLPGSFATTLEIIGTPVPFEISPGLGSLVLGAWGAVAYFKTKGQKKFSGSKFLKTNDGRTQSS